MTDKHKELCVKLMHAETESEIITALDAACLWGDAEAWHPFGGMRNNFSTIGNQQSEPVAALVEKLVNSIDARLTGECLAAGTDPTDPKAAPSSVAAGHPPLLRPPIG